MSHPQQFPRAEAVRLYTVEHWTQQKIADHLNVSKSAIGQALRSEQVDSSAGTWVQLHCVRCSREFQRTRSQVRQSSLQFCRRLSHFPCAGGASRDRALLPPRRTLSSPVSSLVRRSAGD